MRSFSSLLSPPPSPHPAHLPLASSSSSSLTGCPELDLSVTLSPTRKTGHSQLKPHPQGQTRRKRDTEVCFEELVVTTVTTEPYLTLSRDAPPQQPIKGRRRSRGRHHGNHNLTFYTDCLNKYIRLATYRSIGQLRPGSDNYMAVLHRLSLVNVSRSQLLFTSLVSVDVSRMLQDRLVLATPPCCHYNKATDGPSVLLFMSSDLLRQKPLPPEEGPFNRPHPSSRPTHLTFDLYRRQRRWEATP
ncbi:uncharacterized protein LOC120783675 [Xiphias gladius]|uniref:uncharacterized protein LOC120783675 n=1 Tax=Xiphias gladius TaxID=8245 RepID=UPI001A98DDE8|nr:uncharacterized protein LOC120783675 [Xiphias gladius]